MIIHRDISHLDAHLLLLTVFNFVKAPQIGVVLARGTPRAFIAVVDEASQAFVALVWIQTALAVVDLAAAAAGNERHAGAF